MTQRKRENEIVRKHRHVSAHRESERKRVSKIERHGDIERLTEGGSEEAMKIPWKPTFIEYCELGRR